METEHYPLLRKPFAVALLAVGLVAFGACIDAPVSIDPADPATAEEADLRSQDPDRAADAPDSITIHEQDGHRISFTFDTEGPTDRERPESRQEIF